MNWYKKAEVTDYDRDRLEGTGHTILDSVQMGGYNISLIEVPMPMADGGDMRQIAVSAGTENFTDPSVQGRGKVKTKFMDMAKGVRAIPNMVSKVREWMQQGNLYISTHDAERNKKWFNILQHLGFSISSENIYGQDFTVINGHDGSNIE